MTNPTIATAVVQSCVLIGIDAELVSIRCALDRGAPGWSIAGLSAVSAAGAREAMIRVRSALSAAGQGFPAGKISIEATTSTGSATRGALDLATALAVLVAEGVVPAASLEGRLAIGELGLDGGVRPVRGVLSAALRAHAAGLRGILLPAACAWEAALVDGIEVHPIHRLGDLVAALRGEQELDALTTRAVPRHHASGAPPIDMAEVRGCAEVVDQVARAVAGRQGVLLVGPTGTGKTMLARRIPTLLPDLTRDEALQVTQVYSAVGIACGLCDRRPFRAPHHTISATALAGAGPSHRPGELQLAGLGVLYLDELTEFSIGTVAALARELDAMAPASRPLVVASATSCPCGHASLAIRRCCCSAEIVERHQARTRKLAEDLGITTQIETMPTPSLAEMRDASPGESSASLRARLAPSAGQR